MSDLISRSRVIENIWDVFNSYANDSLRFDEYETEAINRAFTVLQKAIEGQPTAYNLDKVVEELEETSKPLGFGLMPESRYIAESKAINIVRGEVE